MPDSRNTRTHRSDASSTIWSRTASLIIPLLFMPPIMALPERAAPTGSVNENKFFNGYPDELSENMKLIDVLGGPDTYEHYPDRMGSQPSRHRSRCSSGTRNTRAAPVTRW